MGMKTWKIVLLVVIGLFAAGGIYATLLVRRGFSARENPSWIEAFAAGVAKSLAVPTTYRMKNPVAPTAENVREGEEHFADHCAICHANDGSGDTLFGKGLYPKPPDMRTAETQNKSDGELYYTIENGVRLSGMPAFGPASSPSSGEDPEADDAETWKLVLFIRRLPQITSEELEDMKKLNPKTEADRAEEHQEEQFLNGGSVPKTPTAEHHH
jgi:mono/diheme cytochrome c family protein